MNTTSAPWPEDYHDYVFKDGRLVGNFDNMYLHARDVPWHQDKRSDHLFLQVAFAMLADHAPYGRILEIGCGLGYIATKLKTFSPSRPDAFDISPEAIRRAQELHQGVEFYVADICNPSFRPRREYDLVFIHDLLFYVFPAVTTVFQNIARAVRPGGWLYVGQCFPALDRPFVGKETIPTPEVLLALLRDYRPVRTALVRNHDTSMDGPLLQFLGVRSS